MKQINKQFSILTLILAACLGLPAVACGQGKPTDSNQPSSNQTQASEIPSAVENSTYDSEVNKESSLFLTVAADNKISLRKSGLSEFKDGKTIIYFNYIPLTEANLIDEITNVLKDKSPDRRLAYISADSGVKFGKLTELFAKMVKSKLEPDQIRLVVNPLKEVEKAQQTESGGYILSLILPQKVVFSDNRKSGGNGSGNGDEYSPAPPPSPPGFAPKPKTAEQTAAEEKAKQIELEKAEGRKKIKIEKLSVELDDAGKIKFNDKAQTPDEFSVNLKKIFDERTAYDIFRNGTSEIEKTVYLKISPNVNYGDAIKLIDKIYGLGANLLYLDGLQDK